MAWRRARPATSTTAMCAGAAGLSPPPGRNRTLGWWAVTAENRILALNLARGNPDDPVTVADAQIMVQVAEVFRRYLDGTTVRLAFTVAVDGETVPTTLTGGNMPTIAVAAT